MGLESERKGREKLPELRAGGWVEGSGAVVVEGSGADGDGGRERRGW